MTSYIESDEEIEEDRKQALADFDNLVEADFLPVSYGCRRPPRANEDQSQPPQSILLAAQGLHLAVRKVQGASPQPTLLTDPGDQSPVREAQSALPQPTRPTTLGQDALRYRRRDGLNLHHFRLTEI